MRRRGTLLGTRRRALPSLTPQPAWRSLLVVALAGFALACGLLGVQFARLGPDPTAPFLVGTTYGLDELLAASGRQVTVEPGTGYDGQWFLGLAYDPFLTEGLTDGFDLPRYRAGRPLYGLAGWLLADGEDALVPLAVLLVGALAAGVGSAATGRLLAAAGWSRWWGLLFVAVPGVAVGVGFATAEPLALAMSVLGLSLVLDGRVLPAGLAFAAATLTKETYAVFAVVAAAWLLAGRPGAVESPRPARAGPGPAEPELAQPEPAKPKPARAEPAGVAARPPAWRRLAAWLDAVVLVAPAALLLGGWWLYVAWRVPAGDDAKALGAVGPPLAGWVDVAGAMAAGEWVADAPIGPLGPLALLGSLALALAGIVAGLRRPGLLGWTAVAMGGYALCLSAHLLGHFMSSMRAAAPCVLAALLGIAAAVRPVRRRDEAAVAERAGHASPASTSTARARRTATSSNTDP